MDYINENTDRFKTKLDNPFSAEELELAIKTLKNNKASSFDMITNEIIKCTAKIYKTLFLHLFNSIGRSCFYPSLWKMDILHPILKFNEKDDPNNFRGILLVVSANCSLRN